VDGVIDRHVFRFPATTPSGLRALALLKGHGHAVYLNTARSAGDVQAYCAAYGLPGGIAETGGWLWDATTGREQVLVGAEALDELARVRAALAAVPGVFLDPAYRQSIKACIFTAEGTAPLPAALVHDVLARAGVRTLAVHPTTTDTAIHARELDKGTGLLALLRFIGREGAPTIAIGDTAPDLAQFRVATRSYAPGHTWVRDHAMLLGCRIAAAPFQQGFLEIARQIVHPEGGSCPHCSEPDLRVGGQRGLLLELLGESERGGTRALLRALADWQSVRALLG
jgi:hypothetical protein